ncbi:hypothetical protein ACET8I_19390 [Aeromonas veronii]
MGVFLIVCMLIIVIVAICVVVLAMTKWCGPTWFQRCGSCLAFLSIALAVSSSEMPSDAEFFISKLTLNNIAIFFGLIGAFLSSFGEVIWNLIHRGERSYAEVLRKFVNS